jgi:streptogramin lyase
MNSSNHFHSPALAKLTAALGSTLIVMGAVAATPLQVGDILWADSFGAVFKYTPATEEHSMFASGDKLVQPFGIAVEANGDVLVSDTGALAIIRIDSQTGTQSVLSSGPRLGVPYGIALEQDGNIVVANSEAIVRVDPISGNPTPVSERRQFGPFGGYHPLGVAVADNGDLIVANGGLSGGLIRVNPRNGQQKRLTKEGALKWLQAIAINGNDIYVTALATDDGNFGVGRVVHFDLRARVPIEISYGRNLVGPVGIAVDGDGQLVVGDPYTINPDSLNLYDGGIIKIDPLGNQNLLVRGDGDFVNPRGVAIVRAVSLVVR